LCKLKLLLNELPSENISLVGFLLALLKDISERGEVNKMTSHNLGIIWSNIFFESVPMLGNDNSSKAFEESSNLIAFMVEHCGALFDLKKTSIRRQRRAACLERKRSKSFSFDSQILNTLTNNMPDQPSDQSNKTNSNTGRKRSKTCDDVIAILDE